MFGFLKKIPKRLLGIALFVASSVAGVKGWVDPATAELGKTVGAGVAGIGVWHAQQRAAAERDAIARAVGAKPAVVAKPATDGGNTGG